VLHLLSKSAIRSLGAGLAEPLGSIKTAMTEAHSKVVGLALNGAQTERKAS